MIRPSWDDYFFQMADLVRSRATCPRASCGAVLVKFKRVIATGYNGAPEGQPHCPIDGEALHEHLALDHCRKSIHAEVNALRNALISPIGATIYVVAPLSPCKNCLAALQKQDVTDIRYRRALP